MKSLIRRSAFIHTLAVFGGLHTAVPSYAFLDKLFNKETTVQRAQDSMTPAKANPANASARGFEHLAKIGNWTLRYTQWSELDEKEFSDFVRAIGRSNCKNVDDCMRGEWNPYRHSDPPKEQYKFWSDCADWPYFLRSYFAWKIGLPVAYSKDMVALPLTTGQQASIDRGEQKPQEDVRYSWNGNRPSERIRLPLASGPTNFFAIHPVLQNSVHTASMRVDPRTNYGDMYTPAIERGAIRPGTTVYDPSGHVGIVYDITENGQVMVFDALIDRKSISPRRAYSGDFYKRSKISHGGWFQNFRPVVIDNARFDSKSGTFIGGTMRLLTNNEINDYSVEMFGTTTTADGNSAYVVDGKITNSFQEFLRRRMFKGIYKLDVLEEFKIRMKGICEDFKSRVSLVQDATITGIASRPHADKLPNTIFGGEGDWDLYSTPGGDVRRRLSVNLASEHAKDLINNVRSGNPDYGYSGNNLKRDLISVASESLNSCSITYRNTNGKNVNVALGNLFLRMPYMSFSPWHCIELRWGATSKEELASCPDMANASKLRWYKAQQSLRNLMVRDTNIFTGYTLQELETNATKVGPIEVPNFNLLKILEQTL